MPSLAMDYILSVLLNKTGSFLVGAALGRLKDIIYKNLCPYYDIKGYKDSYINKLTSRDRRSQVNLNLVKSLLPMHPNRHSASSN